MYQASVTLSGVSSGSIAGPGSYLGLNSNNQIVLTASSGGGATNPAGSDTQIQFNNAGSFGASSNLTFSSNGLAINMGGTSATHGLTLPNNSGVTGKTKATAYLTYSSIRYKKKYSH